MEAFVVSARKYRPSTFESVVGQSHITNTLKNAINLGQLAHAFLFSGPRGVGKTTCARILAKAINCNQRAEDGEPCNTCDSCASFNEARSLNIHELDAASNNSVDDIRKIIDQVRFAPTGGKKSVFIIDEVHMLSQSAFNAFLKTLEEPPAHAIFILATTEKHKILPTILSRVQKFDFRRIKVDDIAEHLKRICEKEDIAYEFEALQLIGLKADGALRDALSIFDQIVSYSNRKVTYAVVVDNLHLLDHEYFFKAVDMILASDHEGLLLMLHEIVDLGFDPKEFMVGLLEHFRNLLVAQTPKTVVMLETSDNVRNRYLSQVASTTGNFLLNAFHLASDTELKLKGSNNPRLTVELGLMKLAYLNQAIDLATSPEKKKLTPETNKAEKLASGTTLSANVPSPPHTPADNPQPKEKVAVKGFFSLPKSLDQVTLDKTKEGKSAEEEELMAYDPTVTVDPGAFIEALDALVDKLGSEKNLRVATLLRKDAAGLDHNKWIQKVNSEISRRMLAEEKEIVNFMREKLNVPNLILEIVVEEDMVVQRELRSYSNQEKLDLMLQKNPNLRDFISKFDALLNY